ncbi:GAF domain-containing protein [Aeromicrobium stalagmiti]|uniref:GAF domain-containing protein n=1 Tax=Aeromicrobium stalagmiti TaxID=2738988 RepID=UPI0020C1BF69|nr:GAF domain-containing protein [Aeromicrobium stalagmiti]
MRSRQDDVGHAASVERALRLGLVGMGEATDEGAERRLERLAAAPVGAFVWTRHPDGRTFVGRIDGPWREDPGGAEVDLVHVREATWAEVDPALVPAAVEQTFARGGRNFQQIHPGDVEAATARVWQRLSA